MKRKLIGRSLPFVVFLVVAGFLYKGLSLDPHKLPSSLLDMPLPNTEISTLYAPNTNFSAKTMLGQVWMLNVWATWCNACQQEHPVLMDMAKTKVPLIGLDYKDSATKAKAWLKSRGNPYQAVLFDEAGTLAIDLGVYGAPETFIIDRKGIIRYKHVGEITPQIWSNQLEPLIKKLSL